MLTNRTYAGTVHYGGQHYPGEHAAIIQPATFERVKAVLGRNGHTKGAAVKNKYGALLKGLLCCHGCRCGMPGALTVDQDKQLKTIQGSARHLLSLINDLLDLAKIESGKLELALEPVKCRVVLDDVVNSLKTLSNAKNLRLEIGVVVDDLQVRADRRALTQILLNLTNNAIKFTDQGSIRLDARFAHGVAGNRGATMIDVTDTGVGIRGEDQEKLFQAFEQVGVTGARRPEGTGLGLHLSQKLAALLGGRVEFKSEFGKGSTFSLVIPEA